MSSRLVVLACAMTLFAAENEAISDAAQKEWFRQSALYYAKLAELNASMSPQQRQIQQEMIKANDAAQAARKLMVDECTSRGMTFNGNDMNPACVVNK